MRHPRVSLYFLNVVGLFAFAVAATALDKAYTAPAVGYGVVFLILLVPVYLLHYAGRRRWTGALTAVFSFAAFITFTALSDNVAAGFVAAVQMAICLGLVPARPHTPKVMPAVIGGYHIEPRTPLSEAEEAMADMRRATARLDRATTALQAARSVH